MMILQGDVTVECPKIGQKVSMRKSCLHCALFSHFMIEGNKTMVFCKFTQG